MSNESSNAYSALEDGIRGRQFFGRVCIASLGVDVELIAEHGPVKGVLLALPSLIAGFVSSGFYMNSDDDVREARQKVHEQLYYLAENL